MLSLAAYNVLTNSQDPFYTSLQVGAYTEHKPSGMPCDAMFNCVPGGSLSDKDKIIIGVIVGVVGLILLLLALYWLRLRLASR